MYLVLLVPVDTNDFANICTLSHNIFFNFCVLVALRDMSLSVAKVRLINKK